MLWDSPVATTKSSACRAAASSTLLQHIREHNPSRVWNQDYPGKVCFVYRFLLLRLRELSSCHKCFSSPWRFVVKQDTIGSEHFVTFAVISRHPIGIYLGSSIGAAWFKGGQLVLGWLSTTEHFTCGCLIEPFWKTRTPDSFKNADCTKTIHITCIFGHIKTNPHVTLSSKIVNLIRFDIENHV